MSHQTYDVRGMSCTHCVQAITREVVALEGVQDVVVRYEHGTIEVIAATQPGIDAVRDAVSAAGYELVGASS